MRQDAAGRLRYASAADSLALVEEEYDEHEDDINFGMDPEELEQARAEKERKRKIAQQEEDDANVITVSSRHNLLLRILSR